MVTCFIICIAAVHVQLGQAFGDLSSPLYKRLNLGLMAFAIGNIGLTATNFSEFTTPALATGSLLFLLTLTIAGTQYGRTSGHGVTAGPIIDVSSLPPFLFRTQSVVTCAHGHHASVTQQGLLIKSLGPASCHRRFAACRLSACGALNSSVTHAWHRQAAYLIVEM